MGNQITSLKRGAGQGATSEKVLLFFVRGAKGIPVIALSAWAGRGAGGAFVRALFLGRKRAELHGPWAVRRQNAHPADERRDRGGIQRRRAVRSPCFPRSGREPARRAAAESEGSPPAQRRPPLANKAAAGKQSRRWQTKPQRSLYLWTIS